MPLVSMTVALHKICLVYQLFFCVKIFSNLITRHARPSHLPSHRHHTSNTAYELDNYTAEWEDPGDPETSHGWLHLHEGHPCYNPNKDLVVTSLKFPQHYRWSPLVGAPLQPKKHLLYFRGDVGKARLPHYSRGIRQKLYNLTVTRKWTARYNISIGDELDLPGDYSQELASSKFCLVAPGDGFSARAEDAVLHGCIPLVIMDRVHQPLQSLLAWHQFSVWVPESKIEQVPEILMSIPEERVQQLSARVRKVMHRFAYLSHPLLKAEFLALRKEWAEKRTDGGRGQESGGADNSLDHGSSFESLDDEEDEHGGHWDFIEHHAVASHGSSNILGLHEEGGVEMADGISGGVRTLPSKEKGGGPGVQGLPRHVFEDDMFGTLMQWLYVRWLDGYN